jgi:hypothetical protein
LELETQPYWIWDVSEGEPEDKLVLCSDGLYSLVGDAEIAEAVSKFSPQESCVHLVELAKERGGFDNITLAVLPLGGQLHEESPGVSGKKVRKKKTEITQAPVYRSRRPKLSLGKKMALMGILLLLGCLVASLFVLLSVAK